MTDYTPAELITAIDIITTIHTRDHDELGFVIEGAASPEWPATRERGVSNGQYADAWETLRCEVHKKGFADQKDSMPVVSRLKEERDELLKGLIRIEVWTRDHGNGTCEAVNTKARELIAKVEK